MKRRLFIASSLATIASGARAWHHGFASPHATFNPADVTQSTLSGGNLTVTGVSGGPGGTRSTTGFSSGKYYWECSFPTRAANNTSTGIAMLSTNLTSAASTATGAIMALKDGSIYVNASNTGVNYGAAGTSPVAVAADFDNKLIWFKNLPSGNWNGNASYSPGGTGGVGFGALTAPYYAIGIVQQNLDQVTANFGASAFTGAVPSGFTAGWPG